MIDLQEHAYGLDDHRKVRIHRLLQDYAPELSLRRIPDNDPIARWAGEQGHTYGVYETGVGNSAAHHGGTQSNWVFTLAEHEIDDRVLARIVEADFRRQGAPERIAKMEAHRRAAEASRLRAEMDKMQDRRDEMMFLAETGMRKTSFTHKINGETVIIGDEIRPLRTRV